ncbi:MAG: ZIP family metal transporter [Thermodesulfovibrionales bacterium]|nr:ZIP family metal transporter [Thermodesulfovibrionales bacterium]
MFEPLQHLSPILQAFFACLFTWAMTALGSALVIFTKKINQKLLDTMLGFAAGVMIAASFWSLLNPAIEMSQNIGVPSWLPPAVGFICGGIFLRLVDNLLPHLHAGFPIKNAEGIKTSWRRTTLLILAVTLHNIPEGLAVGVAFGASSAGLQSASFSSALALAIGIGIQNFPEGAAISMPLRAEGFSRLRSFWYGQLSGMVEPFAALIGASAVMIALPLLPYALSFAAGAMIFVVVEELIPTSQQGENTDLATLGLILGFTLMMILDVGLSQ